MIRRLLHLLALSLGLAPATASAQTDEQVIIGLSRSNVQITTNFDGSEILIFGAIKRESLIPQGPPLQVIVAVSGPSVPVTVRRKERRFGIWVNVDAVEVDLAPSFYAVATSAPWSETISEIEDLRHSVSIPQAIRSVGAPMSVQDSQSFTEALIRVRTNSGLYQLHEETVDLNQQTLFDTAVALPANLTEGAYRTRILLTRDSIVIAEHETTIEVGKVGIERWLFNLSHEQPLLYGLLSLAIAIAAGWGASTGFRLLRDR
ncbi:TIGR02186 family protein [Puniceibacterium sp. IMCC21224]|uniref:TIGR02186 family protein n=1 Tax=Puniceibacterium sp. IMCC21224 TaxID=1618204 RepID=UPI00064D80A5|nr:TIGR02186 family protein [Puniceibacterium sp. IMCC21224]KMK66261.1 putative transmembrane protein [Puniceibacterium sp. IMCC21224]